MSEPAPDPDHLPCPHCRKPQPLRRLFDTMDACWPFRRFVRARCGDCGQQVIVLPGFETVTIGLVSLVKDPELVPSGTVEPDDYRATWSSSGLRINIGELRWTVKASASDLTQ